MSCHASDGHTEGSKKCSILLGYNPQQNHILKGICNGMPKVENFHEIRDWKENTWEIHDGWVIITRLELHLEKMGSSPFISPPAQYHPHILLSHFFLQNPSSSPILFTYFISQFKCTFKAARPSFRTMMDMFLPC